MTEIINLDQTLKITEDNEETLNQKLSDLVKEKEQITERAKVILGQLNDKNLNKDEKEKLTNELNELSNQEHKNFKEIIELSALIDMVDNQKI